jgi:hypothetical protein
MVYKSDALILRTYKLGEADRILTHSRNDAGELMARYGVAPSLAVFAVSGGIPQ